MNKINFLNKYKMHIICSFLFVIVGVELVLILYFYSNNNNYVEKEVTGITEYANAPDIEQVILEEQELVNIDVKGAVKKPGVYSLEKNKLVIDAINAAGGFKSTAYTLNINLSKEIKNEMVIYVATKTEFKKSLESLKKTYCKKENQEKIIEQQVTDTMIVDTEIQNDASIDSPKDEVEGLVVEEDFCEENNTSLININTASKEELMTLPGIGESKANSIITYREQNGNFKTIEDITKVSGIGESMYEKIKDHITI